MHLICALIRSDSDSSKVTAHSGTIFGHCLFVNLSPQLHSYPNFTLTPTSLLPQLHSYPNFTPQPHSYPNFTLTLPSRPIKILSLYICMYVYPSSVHTYYIYVCTYMPHHGHWFLLVLHSTGFQCSRPQVVLSCISCSGSLTL